MTNDTSTLDGSLSELGETMADNLVAMGVSGASASDGLTTLSGKILDIAPSVGGITPVVTIDISKTPSGTITSGDTVIIECKVNANYDDESVADIDLHGYLQGATLTIKNNNTTLGTCVSDNNGIATYTISNIAGGSYSITAHFDGTGTDYESATSTALTFTVINYLINDPLTSDNGLFTIGSTSNASFSSNGLYYNPTASGNQTPTNQIILNQTLPSEFELEITLVSHSKYYTPGIWVNGLFVSSENRSSSTTTSLTNDLSNYASISTYAKNLSGNNHFKYIKQGDDLSLYIDDTLIRTVDVSNYNPIFGLCTCCNQNRYVTVKDLKLKQL